MDAAEREQRREPQDTADVRRVGCKHSWYARHGHELMGWKSPVGVPVMSFGTDATTSRRQGQAREGLSEGSPSANVRADGQKPHRRLSPRVSQPQMTKPTRCGG